MNGLIRRRIMYDGGITPSTDSNKVLELLANTEGNYASTWFDTGYYSTNAIQSITANQPTLTADVFGAGNFGYLFNASQTDYMYVTDNDQLSFTDGLNDLAFTFEVDAIFNTNSGSKTLIFKTGEYMFILISGALWVYCFLSTTYIRAGKAFTPTVGTAYNLKATYTGSKSQNGFELYINGVKQTSLTRQMSGTYTGMVNTSQQLNIGYGSTVSQIFDGYLGNVKLTKGVI